MRRTWVGLGALCTAYAISGFGAAMAAPIAGIQGPTASVPNFAGHWVSEEGSAPLCLRDCVIAQTATELKITSIGRQQITLKLNAQTPIPGNAGGPSTTQTIRWDKDVLVRTVTTPSPGRAPLNAESRWSLVDGKLICEHDFVGTHLERLHERAVFVKR